MRHIEEQVKRLFIATDSRDWDTVKAIFSNEVELDYSSMSGQPAAILNPEDIVNAWKTILPGFTYTHHQLGNIITAKEEDTASVFCYGTASHFLENDDKNLWTVVGTYDFDLVKVNHYWKISKMKFNFKFQGGNLDLPKLAMDALK